MEQKNNESRKSITLNTKLYKGVADSKFIFLNSVWYNLLEKKKQTNYLLDNLSREVALSHSILYSV